MLFHSLQFKIVKICKALWLVCKASPFLPELEAKQPLPEQPVRHALRRYYRSHHRSTNNAPLPFSLPMFCKSHIKFSPLAFRLLRVFTFWLLMQLLLPRYIYSYSWMIAWLSGGTKNTWQQTDSICSYRQTKDKLNVKFFFFKLQNEANMYLLSLYSNFNWVKGFVIYRHRKK